MGRPWGQGPAAKSLELHQKDVVAILVGAHGASGGGEAHHQIVDAPRGQKRDRFEDRCQSGEPVIHGVYQEGPGALKAQRLEIFIRKGPVA